MRFLSPKPAPAPRKPIACDVGTGDIDFHALLREAVGSVNAGHQKAIDDLLTLVSQLDAAVATLSNGQLHLKLVEVADSPTEV
ncbi:MAG TPA: hypothetical protein VF595_12285, partial [Tepidisphaeraceae bacterium]